MAFVLFMLIVLFMWVIKKMLSGSKTFECHACNREISKKAVACPGCGHPA